MLRWSLKLGGKFLEPTFWIFLTTYIYSILVPMDCRQKHAHAHVLPKFTSLALPGNAYPMPAGYQ